MEALLAKSEGIFLWASLAIENLTYFSSGPDFDKFLRKPPSGLKDIYQEMLRTLISREESGEVLNMIWSVALALRPLTFGEFAHILACIDEKAMTEQPTHKGTSSKIQLRTEKEVRIYMRSSLGFLRATSETVSIVHHTATEYLLMNTTGAASQCFLKVRPTSYFPGTASDIFTMPSETHRSSQRVITLGATMNPETQA